MNKRCIHNEPKQCTKKVWHKRFELPSREIVSEMINNNNFTIKGDTEVEQHEYETCIRAKNNKSPANIKLLGKSREYYSSRGYMWTSVSEKYREKELLLTMTMARKRYTHCKKLKNKIDE